MGNIITNFPWSTIPIQLKYNSLVELEKLYQIWVIFKQWPLAPNSRKSRITRANVWNASLIFQKLPLANVSESGESVTAFWRIFKLGRFMYKKIFLGIKWSSLPSPNLPNSPNSLNLLNTHQICRRESQKFGGSLVFANSSTRQKRRIFGEYSNSLNSPASGHCLVIFHFQIFKSSLGIIPYLNSIIILTAHSDSQFKLSEQSNETLRSLEQICKRLSEAHLKRLTRIYTFWNCWVFLGRLLRPVKTFETFETPQEFWDPLRLSRLFRLVKTSETVRYFSDQLKLLRLFLVSSKTTDTLLTRLIFYSSKTFSSCKSWVPWQCRDLHV